MAALMSIAQYEARLGRSLSGVKLAQAEAFLDDASALVRKIAAGELDDSDSTTVPAQILPVIFAMVNRGIHNPRGHDSERVADYQYSGGGNIFATDDEVAQIEDAAGIKRIKSVTMTAPVPLHLKYDIWNNPTYP